jgi:hypothetical protein
MSKGAFSDLETLGYLVDVPVSLHLYIDAWNTPNPGQVLTSSTSQPNECPHLAGATLVNDAGPPGDPRGVYGDWQSSHNSRVYCCATKLTEVVVGGRKKCTNENLKFNMTHVNICIFPCMDPQ